MSFQSIKSNQIIRRFFALSFRSVAFGILFSAQTVPAQCLESTTGETAVGLDQKRSSIFSLTIMTLLLLLGSPATAFGQDSGPYYDLANDVRLADFPFEFQVVSQRRIINGSYDFDGWTPVIRGRILGQTHRGDEVMVALSQNGKLIHLLFAELKGTDGSSWYEDFEIRGDDNDLILEVGGITATFKYYNNRDERTTPLGIRQFHVVKLAENN